MRGLCSLLTRHQVLSIFSDDLIAKNDIAPMLRGGRRDEMGTGLFLWHTEEAGRHVFGPVPGSWGGTAERSHGDSP